MDIISQIHCRGDFNRPYGHFEYQELIFDGILTVAAYDLVPCGRDLKQQAKQTFRRYLPLSVTMTPIPFFCSSSLMVETLEGLS